MESNPRLLLHICSKHLCFNSSMLFIELYQDTGEILSICLSEPGDLLAMHNRCWGNGNTHRSAIFSHDPWAIQCCTTELGYIVPMPYGLYNSIPDPWPMGCATLLLPMAHGLYNSILNPWPMGCTMVCLTHDPWIVQHTHPLTKTQSKHNLT